MTMNELLPEIYRDTEDVYPRRKKDRADVVSVEWWAVVNDDIEEGAFPCITCHGRGLDRFDEDCAACGGMGVVYA